MTEQEKAMEFWDESLPLRVERRITGANAHDARCWLIKYGYYCGRFNYKAIVNPAQAKWYRDVLTIFANGQTDTIRDAQRIHMANIGVSEMLK